MRGTGVSAAPFTGIGQVRQSLSALSNWPPPAAPHTLTHASYLAIFLPTTRECIQRKPFPVWLDKSIRVAFVLLCVSPLLIYQARDSAQTTHPKCAHTH
jgi:hypothetical protein